MEHHAADELHAVGVQPQHAAGRLAHGGKRLRQDVVERFAALQTRLELRRFGLQLRVAHRLVFVRHRFDLVDDGVDALELTVAVGTEHFTKETHIQNFLSWEHNDTPTSIASLCAICKGKFAVQYEWTVNKFRCIDGHVLHSI